MTAQFIGVGVGPGDPELITLKAAKLIAEADVISFIGNAQGESQAKSIAATVLNKADKKQFLPVPMPMSEDRTQANAAYDKAALAIENEISLGKKVVFLCEGDPLFFGSFAYLLERLQHKVICQIVPGITSVNAAASALQQPLTMLKESFAVVSGRHDQAFLINTLKQHDSVAIMKAGRARQDIIQALQQAGRLSEANYLAYISREGQVIETDVNALEDNTGPYFSLFLVLKSVRGAQ